MLQRCTAGVVCLTPENQSDPWINFEAGALSNNLKEDKHAVCALLLDLTPADVKGPLSQFQHTAANSKDDLFKMITTIASVTGSQLPQDAMRELFDRMWPDFEKTMNAAQALPVDDVPEKRKSDDKLDEILETVRAIQRQTAPITFPILSTNPGIYNTLYAPSPTGYSFLTGNVDSNGLFLGQPQVIRYQDTVDPLPSEAPKPEGGPKKEP